MIISFKLSFSLEEYGELVLVIDGKTKMMNDTFLHQFLSYDQNMAKEKLLR